MKIQVKFSGRYPMYFAIFCLIVMGYIKSIPTMTAQDSGQKNYIEIKGLVLKGSTKKPLEYASISVMETNISTITNVEGTFLLKVPKQDSDKKVVISYLGYVNKVIPISDFTKKTYTIRIFESVEKLAEINVLSGNPNDIIKRVMDNRRANSFDEHAIMKAFYRESIKKRKSYASLSESVIDVYSKPIKTGADDYVKLHKVRKSTNYNKLDTLVIKLQGGPYNNLNMDMIKNQDLFFNEDIFKYYKFKFDKAITLNDRVTYVIDFEPNGYVSKPLFYGQLFVDAETYGLSKAFYNLNLEDQKSASKYFVRKKPGKAEVIPTTANYRIDYIFSNGKWYHGYSRIELSFKINWKKRIFNSTYNITIEMAVTDWKSNKDNVSLKNKEKLSSTIILHDEASGFSNPEFWGEHNIIEPDKSIENAIKKINRQSQSNG